MLDARRWYTLPLSAFVFTEREVVTVSLVANPADAEPFSVSLSIFHPN